MIRIFEGKFVISSRDKLMLYARNKAENHIPPDKNIVTIAGFEENTLKLTRVLCVRAFITEYCGIIHICALIHGPKSLRLLGGFDYFIYEYSIVSLYYVKPGTLRSRTTTMIAYVFDNRLGGWVLSGECHPYSNFYCELL